jgi:hypothetical protein
MKFPLVRRRKARADFDEAFDWYEKSSQYSTESPQDLSYTLQSSATPDGRWSNRFHTP